MFDSPTLQFGTQALFYLVINLFFLILTWWALQSFRFEVFFKNPNSGRARLFMVLLTVAIGSTVGNFFFTYLYQSLRLPYLF